MALKDREHGQVESDTEGVQQTALNDFSSLKGLRILVVDDDADSLELVRLILEGYLAQVKTAVSAKEALEAIAQWKPDILLCDIAMPHENGYSLIRKVRRLEAERGGFIPAIALTALAREEDRTMALESGFQMHISKPFDVLELVRRVAILISKTMGLNEPNHWAYG